MSAGEGFLSDSHNRLIYRFTLIRPRILVVEDDGRLAATLERVLAAEGDDA
jgi:hypothetical protein